MLTNGRTSLTRSVLLIEKDHNLREGLIELLGLADVTCLDAPSGYEGVSLFQSHQNNIDLVITDSNLLDKNGAMVVQELEALRPDVKVVILSGHDKIQLDFEFETHPNVSVIQKPFNTFDFLDFVNQQLIYGS